MPRISWPLAIRRRWVATMSAWNVEPVNMEISPTTHGCCIGETTCNAPPPDSDLTDWAPPDSVDMKTCNVLEVFFRAFLQ
jgi:hypothetical protein